MSRKNSIRSPSASASGASSGVLSPAGGAVLKDLDEQGVAVGEGLGLEGELKNVEAVFGGTAAGEHVLGGESEAVEGGRGGGVELGGRIDAPPAVAGEVDPFAAGLGQQGDFVGRAHAEAEARRERRSARDHFL